MQTTMAQGSSIFELQPNSKGQIEMSQSCFLDRDTMVFIKLLNFNANQLLAFSLTIFWLNPVLSSRRVFAASNSDGPIEGKRGSFGRGLVQSIRLLKLAFQKLQRPNGPQFRNLRCQYQLFLNHKNTSRNFILSQCSEKYGFHQIQKIDQNLQNSVF